MSVGQINQQKGGLSVEKLGVREVSQETRGLSVEKLIGPRVGGHLTMPKRI